jgi:hypothetical protein
MNTELMTPHPIPDQRMPEVPAVDVITDVPDTDANRPQAEHYEHTAPVELSSRVGNTALLEQVVPTKITAEMSQQALAGDKASREAVNAYLEKATPSELMDPAVSSLLELQSVRKRYLFPAVARLAERSRYTDGAMKPEEQQLLRKTFNLLGFAPHQAGEIWKTWHSYDVTYTRSDEIPQGKNVGDVDEKRVAVFGQNMTRNFNRIEDVNTVDPNAIQTLFKRDHIRNFGRYDVSSLVAQTQPDARIDQLVVSMADDHNGATDRHLAESVSALGALSNKPKAKRFVEAATGGEARLLLDKAAAEAGPATNVVFVVHANSNSIHFSNRPGGAITSEDITGSDGKPPLLDNSVISRGANVMVLGCESGVKNGIAATIGNRLRVRARSPDIKTLGLERSYWGRLKSKNGEGKSQPLPVYGVNPVRALAARIRTVRKQRNR